MKKIILPLLFLFSIVACEKDDTDVLKSDSIENELKVGKMEKILVCHYSEEDDSWHSITINKNAWKAHEKHGDVWLDQDGDGSTPFNECGYGDMLDSDDTNPDIIQEPNSAEISDISIFNNMVLPVAPELYLIGLQITGTNLPAEAPADYAKYLIKVNNVDCIYLADGKFSFITLTPELVQIGLSGVHLVGFEQEEFINVTVIINSGECESSAQLPNPLYLPSSE